MKNSKQFVEGGFTDSVFVESDAGTDETAANETAWWTHLKNVFNAIWPLFLYAGLIFVLLLYAWLMN